MTGPTARILTLLELLRARRRVNGAELAQRLQVDRRTVRRYIAALSEIGVPVLAERGRDGAYLLAPGCALPPLLFNADEVLALSLGLVAARDLGLADAHAAVASAQAKLEQAMPRELRLRARAIDETLRLDVRAPPAASNHDALSLLSEATQQQRSVHIVYRTRRAQPSERRFDVYGLALYLGHWYAVGHCHLRAGLRTFRLDRVQSVTLANASFGRPHGFDAPAYLREAFALIPRRHSVQVLLRADIEQARCRLAAELGVLRPLPDLAGAPRVQLDSEVDDLDWFARELARLPFELEIVRPAALAERLAAHAQRLLRAALAGSPPAA